MCSSDLWFERYRALVHLRRTTAALRQGPPPVWLDDAGDDVVALRRDGWTVAVNCGTEPAVLAAAGTVVFDSDHGAVTDHADWYGDGPDGRRGRVVVAPGQALVLAPTGGPP